LTIALVLLAAAVVFAAAFVLWRRRAAQRQRARTLAQVLDAADALEDKLRTARAEIEAIAGTEDNPVRDALQEMLRQRLWLQQHGDAATLDQLSQVRDSIRAGAERIDQQLARIERARAPSVH
jgi:methyl-accepting chemotaxis protein